MRMSHDAAAELAFDIAGALHHMRRAMRRGDLEKVERWQAVMERAVRIQARYAELAVARAKLEPQINR